jgi:hypothetical protein
MQMSLNELRIITRIFMSGVLPLEHNKNEIIMLYKPMIIYMTISS